MEQQKISVVTPPAMDYEEVNRLILLLDKLSNAPEHALRAYDGLCLPIRYKSFIQILVGLYTLKKASKRTLINHLRKDNEFVGKAIDQMFAAGFVLKKDSPFLVKPFGRYRIDTHYVLSAKGYRAIVAHVSACLAVE